MSKHKHNHYINKPLKSEPLPQEDKMEMREHPIIDETEKKIGRDAQIIEKESPKLKPLEPKRSFALLYILIVLIILVVFFFLLY
jgi:hypothetical protein